MSGLKSYSSPCDFKAAGEYRESAIMKIIRTNVRVIHNTVKIQSSCLIRLVGVVGVFLVFAPVSVQATLTDSLTIGNAKALSLGHAVTADPPG